MQQFQFRRLVAYVTPHKGVLLIAVALMMGESAIALANPWIAGRFTDLVLSPTASGGTSLLPLMSLWLLLLTAQAGLSFAVHYLLGRTGQRMLANLRSRLYDRLQSLPVHYFQNRSRGDILALLGTDVSQISNFVTGTLVSLLPLLITFFGAVYLLFRISPSIAAIAVVLVPVFFLFTKLMGRRLRPLSAEMVHEHAALFATLHENIGMLPVIKSFTREAVESNRFSRCNARLLRVSNQRLLIEALLTPAVRLLAGLGLLLLLFLSSLQLESGAIQPADVVSILLYGALLTRPMSGLASVYGSVQTARGATQRLVEYFAVRPEPEDAGARPIGLVDGSIRFEDVHFSYPGRPALLQGIELEIKAGETVALTGENGSGKSTIVHLLLRFADPEQGRILVGGVDIRRVSIASLRSQVGVVPQEVLLMNGTVRENIGFGRPDAAWEEIEAAALFAQVHHFVQQLPQGYDTVIGEQGMQLSGGQRQRIALARALLKDPPILILDEATAMFDPSGERSFIEDCREVLENRTVLLITHRPASLLLADRVVTIAQGHAYESAAPSLRPVA